MRTGIRLSALSVMVGMLLVAGCTAESGTGPASPTVGPSEGRQRRNLEVGEGAMRISEINAKILDELARTEQQQGLASYLKLYHQVLQAQERMRATAPIGRTPSVNLEEARNQIREGKPLLSFEDFEPDWGKMAQLFRDVSVLAAADAGDPARETEAAQKICESSSALKALVKTWYEDLSLASFAKSRGIDEEVLDFVTRSAVRPFLWCYRDALLPMVDQELWRRRYCPVCGGKGDFAYLDQDRGARWLLCSRCDAEWLFLRLECPYCGTQNQDALAYYTDDQESYLYRLYVCEQCRTYIKTIDLRQAEAEVLRPLERVLTVDMDRQGWEKGYSPGWTRFPHLRSN